MQKSVPHHIDRERMKPHGKDKASDKDNAFLIKSLKKKKKTEDRRELLPNDKEPL